MNGTVMLNKLRNFMIEIVKKSKIRVTNKIIPLTKVNNKML